MRKAIAVLFDCKDEEWLEAESKLDAARRMPAGPDRFEALKQAGMLRSKACKKLLGQDDDHVP